MDLANVIVECHARERALMLELGAAKIARVEAEGRESKALGEKEAANREKDALTLLAESQRRELETLRASTGTVKKAIQEALTAERENEPSILIFLNLYWNVFLFHYLIFLK